MGFSADWLSLRATADTRARDGGLAKRLVTALPQRDLRILDLGSGTGANMAALALQLPQSQHWVLTDVDPALLQHVTPPKGITCDRQQINLAQDLSPLFDPSPDLVTASAFFDLCGPKIIDRIIAATTAANAAFYTVLTYDGRENWAPPHSLDADVLAAFHADQRSDKGMGAALGPDATTYLADQFKKAGYQVHTAPSDWILEQPSDTGLIAALADGSANAVTPYLGTDKATEWQDARTQATHVLIGHQDLLALPA